MHVHPLLLQAPVSVEPSAAMASSDPREGSPPLLPAEWLDETLARARALLHRDDPFMQALERQREPIT